jgi:electron transport complex protein RnfG
VSITDYLTRDKIIENNAMMLLEALNQVVLPSTYNNDLASSKINLSSEKTGFNKESFVYFATNNNKPVAAIFEVTTLKGYNGTIKVLVGITVNQKITGVRIVQHKETPGLGDKMELSKSNWVLTFNGTSLQNPKVQSWLVKKDGGQFDQFTGATITPRAIVNMIKSTLLYSQNHLDSLFVQYLTSKKKGNGN